MPGAAGSLDGDAHQRPCGERGGEIERPAGDLQPVLGVRVDEQRQLRQPLGETELADETIADLVLIARL